MYTESCDGVWGEVFCPAPWLDNILISNQSKYPGFTQ